VAAVERPRKCRSKEINLVLVVRGDFFARVIVRAPANLAVRIDQLPVLAPVVRAPQLAALRGLAVHGHAITGFDQGVHAIRVPWRHAHRDSSEGRMRQTVAFQTLPSRSFIGGLEQSAAWAAALSPIGVNLELDRKSTRLNSSHV